MCKLNANICRALFLSKIRVRKNKGAKKIKFNLPFSTYVPGLVSQTLNSHLLREREQATPEFPPKFCFYENSKQISGIYFKSPFHFMSESVKLQSML